MSLGYHDSIRKEQRRKGSKTNIDDMKNPFEKIRFANFGSGEEAVYKLVKDIQKFKVHLPEDFQEDQLMEGCGSAVCVIVNDLTNRELIRRKFTFDVPSIHKYSAAPTEYADDDVF